MSSSVKTTAPSPMQHPTVPRGAEDEQREPSDTVHEGDEKTTEAWYYLESLERSPWTEQLSISPEEKGEHDNNVEKVLKWMGEHAEPLGRRVGSPAPTTNNQTVELSNESETLVSQLGDIQKGHKTRGKRSPKNSEGKKIEGVTNNETTLVEETEYNLQWPGTPWVYGEHMTTKLLIPTKDGRWEDARYVYLGVHHHSLVIWGTMGQGEPRYNEPLETLKPQIPKTYGDIKPLIRTKIRRQEVDEREFFQDVQRQVEEHSIHHHWKALRALETFRRHLVKRLWSQELESSSDDSDTEMGQVGSIHLWEEDVPFTYVPCSEETMVTGGTEDTTNKRKRGEQPQRFLYNYAYKMLSSEDRVIAVPLYRGTTKMVHPEEREHAMKHSCFCHIRYCPYHQD